MEGLEGPGDQGAACGGMWLNGEEAGGPSLRTVPMDPAGSCTCLRVREPGRDGLGLHRAQALPP